MSTTAAATKPKATKKAAADKPAKAAGSTAAAAAAGAAHPKYDIMVKEAITKLKDRDGSSRQAIVKHIEAQYQTGEHTTKY
ncbi:hypothetical protein CAOG_009408, partial [Capsaspora owczarzaki ATCC 30864]